VLQNKGGGENENGKEKENLSLDCELGYKNLVLHKEKFCEWNKKKNKVLKVKIGLKTWTCLKRRKKVMALESMVKDLFG
jgi:hypothetical protein